MPWDLAIELVNGSIVSLRFPIFSCAISGPLVSGIISSPLTYICINFRCGARGRHSRSAGRGRPRTYLVNQMYAKWVKKSVTAASLITLCRLHPVRHCVRHPQLHHSYLLRSSYSPTYAHLGHRTLLRLFDAGKDIGHWTGLQT